MSYRVQDEEKYAEVLGKDWYNQVWSEGRAWRTVYLEQANYGMFDDRQELARTGLCFLGAHGPGGDYTAYLFAAFGGEHIEVPAIEDNLVAFLAEDGEIEKDSLVEAKRYLKLARRAREALGMEAGP